MLEFFLHFILTTYSLLIALLDSAVLLGIGPRPNTFSYSELKAATEDFSPSNKLGEGGFGPVYKVNYFSV